MPRKPRPLDRDTATFRDDRLLLIACDDRYAPKQYFNFFEFERVQVYVSETVDSKSSAKHVLDRLLQQACEADDERWLVLDTDHTIKGNHLKSLVATIRRARQLRVNIAFSRPCFEFWLLLHHTDVAQGTLDDPAVTQAQLKAFLGAYDKTRLRAEDFTAEGAAKAYVRAKGLEVNGHVIPDIPASRIHNIFDSIFSMADITKLPAPLRLLAEAYVSTPP